MPARFTSLLNQIFPLPSSHRLLALLVVQFTGPLPAGPQASRKTNRGGGPMGRGSLKCSSVFRSSPVVAFGAAIVVLECCCSRMRVRHVSFYVPYHQPYPQAVPRPVGLPLASLSRHRVEPSRKEAVGVLELVVDVVKCLPNATERSRTRPLRSICALSAAAITILASADHILQ
jgi:hypothetical protein